MSYELQLPHHKTPFVRISCSGRREHNHDAYVYTDTF
jgi:hypothetical protein